MRSAQDTRVERSATGGLGGKPHLGGGQGGEAPMERSGGHGWPERRDGQEGQAMLFAAISFFFVFLMIFAVFRAGMVAHNRLALQNAADMAAHSGSNVEANNVSMMAFVNRGMAFLYYNMMRYAVDCAVFGTFKAFKDHKGFELAFLANGYMGSRVAPDDWIATRGPVLNRTGAGIEKIYAEAKKNWDSEVPDGLDWVRDLYETQRGLAEATPLLVRREVFRVATDNGAEAVCLFPDTTARGGSSSGLALRFDPHAAEGGSSGQASFVKHEADLKRWAYQISAENYWPGTPFPKNLAPLAVREERLPEWFDAKKAAPKRPNAYYQIRECWNRRCNQHSKDQSHFAAGAWPWKMKPAGHFHHIHVHIKIIKGIPVVVAIHRNGHNWDRHTTFWDFYIPVIPMPFPVDGRHHHAVLDCPTCFRVNFTKWDADNDSSTDVMLDLSEARVGKYSSVPIRPKWPHRASERFAPPIVLDEAVFKYGINVGVWKEPEVRRGFLTDAPWGYIAVASAKIGFLREGRTVVFRQDTRRAGDPNRDFKAWMKTSNNLYELGWGAKLVPARDALFDADKRGDFLLRGLVGGVWMTDWRDPVGNPRVNLALSSMRLENRSGAGIGSGFGFKGERGLPWNLSDPQGNDDAIRH